MKKIIVFIFSFMYLFGVSNFDGWMFWKDKDKDILNLEFDHVYYYKCSASETQQYKSLQKTIDIKISKYDKELEEFERGLK